jgi:hypothetical protein
MDVMNVEIRLLGTTPLLQHNPRLMDPDDEVTRAIKALTQKRKKTDHDHAEIARLEWYGGLHTGEHDGVECVVMPTAKVRKSFIDAGKVLKLGKAVERALKLKVLHVPLAHDGPRDLKELGELPHFRSRLPVVVCGKRVMRVRPQFLPWGAVAPFFFVEDAGLNFDELVRIGDLAGTAAGLGDNRANGYGAFLCHICDVDAKGYKPVEPTIKALAAFFEALNRGRDAA